MAPTIAVWKFSSCDGCQLSLLDCEDELLGILGRVQIAYFPEATRAEIEGPWDVSLVEGSVTTAHDARRIGLRHAGLVTGADGVLVDEFDPLLAREVPHHRGRAVEVELPLVAGWSVLRLERS